jgi:predicted membrane chloride channel (bestrophin family)
MAADPGGYRCRDRCHVHRVGLWARQIHADNNSLCTDWRAAGDFPRLPNNAAYDRFWEASILWSSLAHTARTLASQANLLIHAKADDKELVRFRHFFVRRIIAFVHSLCHELRDGDAIEEITRLLPDEDVAQVRDAPNRPRAILQMLGRDLAHARNRQWIDELIVPVVAGRVSELSGIVKSCQRIKSTPIPFPYTALTNRLVTFHLLLSTVWSCGHGRVVDACGSIPDFSCVLRSGRDRRRD